MRLPYLVMLLVGAGSISARADSKATLWSCDTVAKNSVCFEVEDAELARKSDTGMIGKQMLADICEAGGGKLAAKTCPTKAASGTCLEAMPLPRSFYPDGAPDHVTGAAHYYAGGSTPANADDQHRCEAKRADGATWVKGYAAPGGQAGRPKGR